MYPVQLLRAQDPRQRNIKLTYLALEDLPAGRYHRFDLICGDHSGRPYTVVNARRVPAPTDLCRLWNEAIARKPWESLICSHVCRSLFAKVSQRLPGSFIHRFCGIGDFISHETWRVTERREF